MSELTYNMKSSESAFGKEYQPLQFNDDFFTKDIASTIAKDVLNIITNHDNSKSTWKKAKKFELKWTEKETHKSKVTSFYEITELLKKNRKYDPKGFDLPPLPFSWLDKSVEVGMPFYAPANEKECSLTFELDAAFGQLYPITPKIDREGFASGSPQNYLLNMLLLHRNELVQYSGYMFTPNDGIWLSRLMSYFNISVSVVEITLTQLYYKAKYDPNEFQWEFDESKLGSTVCARMTDKLKWIHLITNRHLDNISTELAVFKKIKNIRNHLNHIDPPVFAYSIEDVAEWLNSIFYIAMFLYKIRKSIDSHISKRLIDLLLQPTIKFVPRDPEKPRYPQRGTGYASCYEEDTIIDGVKIKWK
jgi:hypothetical protein